MKSDNTFVQLLESIQAVHRELVAQAGRAVNISLTLRNWLIGHYIAEYEMNGQDRAAYGEKLLSALAAELKKLGVSRSEEREPRRYRQFYQVYPQIRETLPPELNERNPENFFEMRLPVSPHDEQKEIIAAIKNSPQKAKGLSKVMQQSISLAKERRATLRTATVTGQIPIEAMCP